MTKKLHRRLALTTAGMLCLLNTLPAQAAPAKSEIEQLKQQVQMLMQQNQQLNQRLTDMEKGMQSKPAAAPEKAVIEEEIARQLKEKKSGPNINEYVSLSGSIEGDYKLSQGRDGANKSEFVLDTVELILDAKITDWATGKIVVDYDGDDEDRLYLDEGHITLGNTEDFPFFLTGGKIYAPFGDYSTNMIQDPLTQTVGEINPKGVIAGYEHNGITATVFSYNGMDEGDEDNDTINGFGASLGYSYEKEGKSLQAGVSWVSNIGDSSGITDYLESDEDGKTAVYSITDEVPGLSLNLGGSYGAFSLITEYTTALDSFVAAELAFGDNGAEPSAWNSELAYTTAIMDKETVFAVGYQKSWEAYALDIPEHRYITSASMTVFEGTTVILEYYLDEFYDQDPDAINDDGYGFTTRLAYEF